MNCCKPEQVGKHRTEWCVEADKKRCMRCGWSSKYVKMPGKCEGPKFLSTIYGKWRKKYLGGHDLVRRVDRQGRGSDMEKKVFGLCEAKNGTKTDEYLQAGTDGYPWVSKMLKIIQVLEDGRVPAKEARSWRIERQKRRITRKEYQRLLNKFEMEGFMARGRIVEPCWREDPEGKRGVAKGGGSCHYRVQGCA